MVEILKKKDPAAMIDMALGGLVKMREDLLAAIDVASEYMATNDEIIKQKQQENDTHKMAIERANKSLEGLEALLG